MIREGLGHYLKTPLRSKERFRTDTAIETSTFWAGNLNPRSKPYSDLFLLIVEEFPVTLLLIDPGRLQVSESVENYCGTSLMPLCQSDSKTPNRDKYW